MKSRDISDITQNHILSVRFTIPDPLNLFDYPENLFPAII